MISEKILKYGAYRAAQRITGSLSQGIFRMDWAGLEYVPKTGSYILISNHLSHLDPTILGSLILRRTIFMARDTLFVGSIIPWIYDALGAIPIKRDADADVAGLKRILRSVREGLPIGLFIEGTRSISGELQRPKPGAGMIACRTQVPVLPIRLFGQHHVAFGKQGAVDLNAPMSLRIGKPFGPEIYDPGPSDPNRYATASQRMMERIAALKPVEEVGI